MVSQFALAGCFIPTMVGDMGYVSDSSSEGYLEIWELEDLLPRESEIDSGPEVTEELDNVPSSQSEKTETNKATSLHARAYQLEMLEESLKQNIIVAVSTHAKPLTTSTLLTSRT